MPWKGAGDLHVHRPLDPQAPHPRDRIRDDPWQDLARARRAKARLRRILGQLLGHVHLGIVANLANQALLNRLLWASQGQIVMVGICLPINLVRICGRGTSCMYIHFTLQAKEKSGDLTCTWPADGYDDDMLLYAKTYRKENKNTRECRVTEQVSIR